MELVPGSDKHPATSSDDSSLTHILTDADILGQVCCHGAVAQSDTVAQLSRQFLTRLLSLTEETNCPDLEQLLLLWIPYIEVYIQKCTHVMAMYIYM